MLCLMLINIRKPELILAINQPVFLLNVCLIWSNFEWQRQAMWRHVIYLYLYLPQSHLPCLTPSHFLSLSHQSDGEIKVMESQGRWSAVSCCHWPRTRRICRDRQYARAGQKLIPWIIKAKEKSTEDAALLRGRKKILISPGGAKVFFRCYRILYLQFHKLILFS